MTINKVISKKGNKNRIFKYDNSKNNLPEQYRHTAYPIDEPIRFNHEHCGDTRGRLYVTRTLRQGKMGWLFHCHNCAPMYSGFQFANESSSPKITAENLRQAGEDNVTVLPRKDKIGMPLDRSRLLPEKALKWLKQYGLTDKEIRENDYQYSETQDRLIFPIYNKKGQLLAWQGRDVSGNKSRPKYITRKVTEDESVLFEVENENSNALVLVEDVVSAIKCGRHLNAIAILGSYLPVDSFVRFRGYDTVYIWLDADKYEEAISYRKRLVSLGIRAVVLFTQADPKEQADSTIKQMTERAGSEPKQKKRNCKECGEPVEVNGKGKMLCTNVDCIWYYASKPEST